MATHLTVKDQTALGATSEGFDLEFLTERITVRELIRSRVFQEVKDYNAKQPEHFRGLVQPSDTEETLNGFAMTSRKQKLIDWEEQFEKALGAYENNGFLVLIDDHEVTGLDTEIELRAGSVATFLRIVPLVGG